jgi:magnesium chelatase subunit D
MTRPGAADPRVQHDAARDAQNPGPDPESYDAADAARLAAALFAVDPAGLGGICVRSPLHPARDAWLSLLRRMLPAGTPWRKIPSTIPDSRLLGGLDLVATLKANRPVAERGLLAEAHGGVVILTMAERLGADTVARLGAVLDAGEVMMPREGVTLAHAAQIGVIALDEGASDDEHMPMALLDRLAFWLDFAGMDVREEFEGAHDGARILGARELLPSVTLDDEVLGALCATALGLGAGSPRVSVLAARVARAAAALDGRHQVTEADAVLAGRLVLAPRATLAPPPDSEAPSQQQTERDANSQSEPEPAAEPAAPPDDPEAATHPATSSEADSPAPNSAAAKPPDHDAADSDPRRSDQNLDDVVLEATRAAIPAGLLARLRATAGGRAARTGSAGKAGALRRAGGRGRPAGLRAGPPQGRMRLNVIETLRAAAPWQRLRGKLSSTDTRVRISAEDFRTTRYKQRSPTLTIFVVDASGSSALNRLAEAKGAVELLLADCYIRRDQVAVVAFRGKKAEILLPPTRSLVRAKRGLAGLPGGGGTPLASALETAHAMALLAKRRGETPTLVILTDGRANIARDGAPGRETAHAQALDAARGLTASNIAALFVDTSPRPNPLARDLAAHMHAHYLPLPFADARSLSAAVKAVAPVR